METFLFKNIYPIWTWCKTSHSLFTDYIPGSWKTANPIIITGFDNQLYLDFSSKKLVANLDSVLKQLDLPVVKSADYSSMVLPTIDSLVNTKISFLRGAGFHARCGNYLKEIREQAGGKLSKNDFWIIAIDNLIQFNLQDQTRMDKDRWISFDARDFQMAQNLKWLTEVKYAGEKIIVWAANEHIAKYAHTPGKAVRMSYHYTRDSLLMKQSYIIGFTSYQGMAGRLGPRKSFEIRKPKSDGFENWINPAYNYSFTDLRPYNKQLPIPSEPFYLKALGHQTFFKYDWSKVFDGVFFVRDMYSCKDNEMDSNAKKKLKKINHENDTCHTADSVCCYCISIATACS
jgi:erythromycin esterase